MVKKKSELKTLTDADISVSRPERRAFLGLAAVGAAALVPTAAQAADADNGAWVDAGSCPRGYGGVYTGYTDADSGNQADQGGYGRGAPYC
ncbi:twin-arginine translocation signal domain-containing protein [Cochlodiniinecator piscidefendens]|uniref:twin-arginine translocation signal domain-containing protein n=1 Tax=Cochlodiniinecator piscidefendens TaxID=2715756 RepID=UPI00140B3B21|nr:twin-arginine translocation signal domain-containing protein [Cochlodiniinecator piscidefendens]